jgi:hypothetical protein
LLYGDAVDTELEADPDPPILSAMDNTSGDCGLEAAREEGRTGVKAGRSGVTDMMRLEVRSEKVEGRGVQYRARGWIVYRANNVVIEVTIVVAIRVESRGVYTQTDARISSQAGIGYPTCDAMRCA